jgi:DNA repair protein RecO
MNNESATEGIILKSTPFKESKVILLLFTKDFGLISAIASIKKGPYLSSMMLIEGTLSGGKSEIYTLKEPYILNSFPNLRKDFDLLQLALKLINTLSKTLVKERATPPLFTLTKNTLGAFTSMEDAKAIYFCFHLKLLLFEGLLPLNPEDIDKNLSEKEKTDYFHLATVKKFADLKGTSISPSLEQAMENYFLNTLH